MTKEKDQASSPSEEPKEQHSGGTAVLDRPKDIFEDDDLVTVLNGWGRVPPGSKHFVDKILFTEGVARNVAYGTAKSWTKKTSAVKVHVLPNDATDADFCKVTGITPMPVDRFASMLAGIDLDALATQMGTDKLKKLIDGLDKHLPKHMQRGT
jgi:hypothetical protein